LGHVADGGGDQDMASASIVTSTTGTQNARRRPTVGAAMIVGVFLVLLYL
jgi:hypothetical protein